MSCAYLEITTRCNMKCPHCCVDAKMKGIVMSKQTFENARMLLRDMMESGGELFLTVGGGEPTMHRYFMPWVRSLVEMPSELVTRYTPTVSVAVITNGTRPKQIQRFFDYREEMGLDEEQMSMSLSTDMFHDLSMVSPEVYDKFARRLKRTHGPQSMEQVIPVGRAKKNGIGRLTERSYDGGTYRRCVCSSLIIRANGNVVPCGCEDAPIVGNVNSVDKKLRDFLEYASYADCWHDGENKLDPEEDNYRVFRDLYGYDYPAKDTLPLKTRYREVAEKMREAV